MRGEVLYYVKEGGHIRVAHAQFIMEVLSLGASCIAMSS